MPRRFVEREETMGFFAEEARTRAFAGFEAYRVARRNMVEGQLRAMGVRDEAVLTAMESLPREHFAPPALQSTAYRDGELPLTPGRVLLAPPVLARLVEAARLQRTDRVLDIAPGTGYSTALLAALSRFAIGVEEDSELARVAMENLTATETQNARIEGGPLVSGWRAPEPYQAILINGGVSFLPDALLAQLAEGGRLVCVFYPSLSMPIGKGRLYIKQDGIVSCKDLFDAQATCLESFQTKKPFVL